MAMIYWILCVLPMIAANFLFYGDQCHPLLTDSFFCNETNTSVPLMWVCDGVEDCADPVDEHDEDNATLCDEMGCPEGYIRCGGGRCIREIKLCDDINDCIPKSYNEPAWDEDLIRCPNPCILEKPCKNGGECLFNKANGTYTCDCDDDFTGINCEVPPPEEAKGLDAVTIGVVSAVGGVTAANTACMVYSRVKDAKDKAKQIKGKISKGIKHGRDIHAVGAKKKKHDEDVEAAKHAAEPLLGDSASKKSVGSKMKGVM